MAGDVYNSGVFTYGRLTSVVIPDTITTIGEWSFFTNNLGKVVLPSSVIAICDNAFSFSGVTEIVVEGDVQYIGQSAFEKSENNHPRLGDVVSNPNLENITFTSKSCDEIKDIKCQDPPTGESAKMFPWLYYSWYGDNDKYYLDGYKVSIYGTDGDCSY